MRKEGFWAIPQGTQNLNKSSFKNFKRFGPIPSFNPKMPPINNYHLLKKLIKKYKTPILGGEKTFKGKF